LEIVLILLVLFVYTLILNIKILKLLLLDTYFTLQTVVLILDVSLDFRDVFLSI
jgi:hypothetical protein